MMNMYLWKDDSNPPYKYDFIELMDVTHVV